MMNNRFIINISYRIVYEYIFYSKRKTIEAIIIFIIIINTF